MVNNHFLFRHYFVLSINGRSMGTACACPVARSARGMYLTSAALFWTPNMVPCMQEDPASWPRVEKIRVQLTQVETTYADHPGLSIRLWHPSTLDAGLDKCRASLLRIFAENRSSSSKCRSLLGFQTSLFISDCFGCNFWPHSEPCSEFSCIQHHARAKTFPTFAPSSEVAVLIYWNLKRRPFLEQGRHKLVVLEDRTWRQSRVLTAKSMAQLLGQRSSTGWAGWKGKYKHMESPSRHC